jgi:formylglycine-generating enzyme required for sulfatase activity
MKKKAHSPPPAPPPRLRWPWLAALALGLALAAGAAALVSSGDRPDPRGPAPVGMVWVPAGVFWMGSDEYEDTLPVHRVYVDGFWMDATEVTNEQFAAFVAATGYKTIAERQPDPRDFPDVDPKKLAPFSGVFVPPAHCTAEECRDCNKWWKPIHGACWKHPEGPGTSIEGRARHPVVHIAWHDTVAYAEWAGKRLPTEAEWERAARGGLDRKPFYWGDELQPAGKWMANIWQGAFPCENTAADGFRGTAPVASFPPNGYGLYDMAGNAWEWCSDWYQPGYLSHVQESGRDGVCRNPQGPSYSYDTHGRSELKRVQRGGSFLCSDSYCSRYRAGGRMQGEPSTSLAHTGFRCVLSPRGKMR